MRKLLLATAAVLLGLANNSYAAPVTFFGEDTKNGQVASSHPNADSARALFFSNLTGGVGTETFESFANGTGTSILVSFGTAGTATLTGTGFVEQGTSSSEQFAISGTKYYDTNGTFGITFSAPISAFGFYGTDIGDVRLVPSPGQTKDGQGPEQPGSLRYHRGRGRSLFSHQRNPLMPG